MSDSGLPTIVQYFNQMIAPRRPELGSFRVSGSPGKVVCPFHDDVAPSMGIIPGQEVFHCFGCGASGNVIRLHQMFLRTLGYSLDYESAWKDLCDSFGLPEPSPPDPDSRSRSLMRAVIHTPRFQDGFDKVTTLEEWSDLIINYAWRQNATD